MAGSFQSVFLLFTRSNLLDAKMNGAFHYITISRFCQSKGNIPQEIVPQEIHFKKIMPHL
jgi:hypothetical protein